MPNSNEEQFDPNLEADIRKSFKVLETKTKRAMPQVIEQLVDKKCTEAQPYQKRNKLFRIISVAAVFLLCGSLFVFYNNTNNSSQNQKNIASTTQEPKQPRTIVDAYRLAVLLEKNQHLSEEYDYNKDGVTNHHDVEHIALSSVSLD